MSKFQRPDKSDRSATRVTNNIYDILNSLKKELDGRNITMEQLLRDIKTNQTNGNQLVATTRQDDFYNDAFQRLRTSETDQRFDCEFLYDLQPLLFDQFKSSGSITHIANGRHAELSLTDAAGGEYAILAQKRPNIYTAGNSQQVLITAALNPAEIAGTAEIFIRSNVTGTVTETTYAQTAWTENTVSDVDWNNSQIFVMDFQSLKVGRIRFGLDRGGLVVPVSEIVNDNIRTTGYWQLAHGFVYYKVGVEATAEYSYSEIGYGDGDNAIGFRFKTTNASASLILNAICCTVKSEGGGDLADIAGLPFSATNDTTAKTISTTLNNVLTIQVQTDFKTYHYRGIVLPTDIEISTDQPIHWKLILNTTLGGSPSYSTIDTECNVKQDVAGTTITGGTVVATGYASSTTNNRPAATKISLTDKEVLGVNFDGTSGDTLTFAAVRTGASDATVRASINFKEIR